MSYGPNLPDLYRRAADKVDKILTRHEAGGHSGRAADQVRAVVNLTTAKVLGLEIPPTLLARADEVIE